MGAFSPFFEKKKQFLQPEIFVKEKSTSEKKIPHAKAGPVSLLIKIIQLMRLIRPSRASQMLWSPQKAALRRCWFREQLCILFTREKMDDEIKSAAEIKEQKEIKMHTQVQLHLELFLMGSLISRPHSIVILGSSASFLAHRAEAAPLIREKSIICFLALLSASSHSLFIVGSSNPAPKSAGAHSHSTSQGKLGWFHRLKADQELETSTKCGVLKHQLQHFKPNWDD